MDSRKKRFALHSIAVAMALALVACGGGGDDDDTPGPGPGPGPDPEPPPPVIETLTGQVARAGTLKNVVVCMDLNANDTCDAGEPASAPTEADGVYTLSYERGKFDTAQVAAASLIAPVLAGDVAAATTAIDSNFPAVAATSKSYVLKRPAGSDGAINPLTTLLQAGIAAGMSEADARANVALQLGIDAAKIDNYQDDPAYDIAAVQDTARVAAAFTSAALRDGAALEVGRQAAAVAAAPFELSMFHYFDAGNFYSRELFLLDKPAGEVGSLVKEVQTLKTNGQSIWPYNSAMLTPSGWRVCDDALPIVGTRGNPNRSTYCGAQTALVFRKPAVSVAGRSMAEVAAEMGAARGNTLNNGNGSPEALAGALGGAEFPEGSAHAERTALNLATPLRINSLNTDGRPQSLATTLAQLIDAYQASNANLSNGGGTLSLGILENWNRNLRAAFTAPAADSGPVQYYGCDLNDAQTVVSNCAPIATGTYTIGTTGGARVMQFDGHPVTIMDHTRGYTEVDWGGENGKWVYVYRQSKPAQNFRVGFANRLNATAWAAMKAQLGL